MFWTAFQVLKTWKAVQYIYRTMYKVIRVTLWDMYPKYIHTFMNNILLTLSDKVVLLENLNKKMQDK